jgi:hypothetical protein
MVGGICDGGGGHYQMNPLSMNDVIIPFENIFEIRVE